MWGYALEGSAHSLLAESAYGQDDEYTKSAKEDAKEFLTEILANGEMACNEVQKEANNAGHSWATVKRAKKDLRIKSSLSILEKCWYWRLPS